MTKQRMKSILTSLTILAALAVSAFAAETAPIRLEGKFGRVEINPARPELESLTLRRADGTLEPHSLLSPKGVPRMRSMPAWATQALTFAVDETGRRFESRNRAPESVEQTANGVTLRGVTLTCSRACHQGGAGVNKISPKDQVSLVAGAMRHCLFSAPSKPVDTMPRMTGSRVTRRVNSYPKRSTISRRTWARRRT